MSELEGKRVYVDVLIKVSPFPAMIARRACRSQLMMRPANRS